MTKLLLQLVVVVAAEAVGVVQQLDDVVMLNSNLLGTDTTVPVENPVVTKEWMTMYLVPHLVAPVSMSRGDEDKDKTEVDNTVGTDLVDMNGGTVGHRDVLDWMVTRRVRVGVEKRNSLHHVVVEEE